MFRIVAIQINHKTMITTQESLHLTLIMLIENIFVYICVLVLVMIYCPGMFNIERKILFLIGFIVRLNKDKIGSRS